MTQLVDDSNPAVQYQAGWDWQPNIVPEVDGTRHGAALAGITASYAFYGTGVQVVGTLEPNSGTPKTSYAIDGEVISTYQASRPSSSQYNVTFFSKRDLEPGNHEIVITNLDATSPNKYWLDYLLIDPSVPNIVSTTTTSQPPAQQTTTTQPQQQIVTVTAQQPTSTSTTTTNGQSLPTTVSTTTTSTSTSSSSSTLTGTNTSVSGTSSTSASVLSSSSASRNVTSLGVLSGSSASTAAPLADLNTTSASGTSLTPGATVTGGAAAGGPTGGAASSASASAGHSNLAAIVGGILGGVALLALLLITFILWRKRRARGDNVHPFMSMREDGSPPSSAGATSPGTEPAGPVSRAYAAGAGGVPLKVREAWDLQMAMATPTQGVRPASIPYASDRSDPGSPPAHGAHAQAQAYGGRQQDLARTSSGNSHTSARDEKLHDALYGGLNAAGGAGAGAYYERAAASASGSTSHLLPSPISTSPSEAGGPSTLWRADSFGSRADTRADFEGDANEEPYAGASADPLVAAEAARAPWYAPRERQSRAESVLRAVSRGRRAGAATEGAGTGAPRGRGGAEPTQDVDSGLRLYSDATLPPPYTPD